MVANRILIVEDDLGFADGIGINLDYVGYAYKVFNNGQEAADYLKEDHEFDLALLDIMLPGMDGIELFKHVTRYNIPIIYITAKTDSSSEIKCLREGAEDYLVKPFNVVTLLVRIEKVLERTGKIKKVLFFKDYSVDTENRTVFCAEKEIILKPLEFDVLVMLLKNKNRTVHRERLLNEIWGIDYIGGIRTLDVHIANIRKKLGISSDIKTIPKIGYRLED